MLKIYWQLQQLCFFYKTKPLAYRKVLFINVHNAKLHQIVVIIVIIIVIIDYSCYVVDWISTCEWSCYTKHQLWLLLSFVIFKMSLTMLLTSLYFWSSNHRSVFAFVPQKMSHGTNKLQKCLKIVSHISIDTYRGKIMNVTVTVNVKKLCTG